MIEEAIRRDQEIRDLFNMLRKWELEAEKIIREKGIDPAMVSPNDFHEYPESLRIGLSVESQSKLPPGRKVYLAYSMIGWIKLIRETLNKCKTFDEFRAAVFLLNIGSLFGKTYEKKYGYPLERQLGIDDGIPLGEKLHQHKAGKGRIGKKGPLRITIETFSKNFKGSFKDFLAKLEKYKSTQYKNAPWIVQDVTDRVFFTDHKGKTKKASFNIIQRYLSQSSHKQ